MPATIAPFPASTRPHDPASHAALAELLQLGMTVARAAARLADVENTALDALADATAATTLALATPPSSLGDALRAGRDADASEAARDAAIARVAAITECFDKAARAVRRTVTLQARLASGRPFQDAPPSARGPAAHDRPTSRPADADPAERADRPERSDEIEGMTDEEVLRDVRRTLAAAAVDVTRLPTVIPFAVPPVAAPPVAAPPPSVPPGSAVTPGSPPAPDT